MVSQIVITAAAFLVAGCPPDDAAQAHSSQSAPEPPTANHSTDGGLPVSVRVKQRSTTSIPALPGRLALTIDDITRGQVMVTLIANAKEPMLGPLSMKQGESAEFAAGDRKYSLKLTELANSLVGDDFAAFVINRADSRSLTESQKIELLIESVEKLTAAEFVRNGTGYSSTEAANHLRGKREATKNDIHTASDFIDQVASKSSITGEDYRIRYSDGRTISARKFLRDHLAKLETSLEQPRNGKPSSGRDQESRSPSRR